MELSCRVVEILNFCLHVLLKHLLYQLCSHRRGVNTEAEQNSIRELELRIHLYQLPFCCRDKMSRPKAS